MERRPLPTFGPSNLAVGMRLWLLLWLLAASLFINTTEHKRVLERSCRQSHLCVCLSVCLSVCRSLCRSVGRSVGLYGE